MNKRCHLCGVVVRPAVVVINRVPLCREHSREVIALPLDLRIEPAKAKRAALAVVP